MSLCNSWTICLNQQARFAALIAFVEMLTDTAYVFGWFASAGDAKTDQQILTQINLHLRRTTSAGRSHCAVTPTIRSHIYWVADHVLLRSCTSLPTTATVVNRDSRRRKSV